MEFIFGPLLFVLVLALLVILVFSNVRIVPQAYVYVIERLGAYHVTWDTGLHLKLPFLDRISKKVSIKEQVVDFKPQPVITKDNVTMQIDTVVFYQVTDAKLYTYGVERPISAIENLTATTLRNIIGELELDHTLTSRDTINTKLRAEGEKRSQILVAEGEKESAILRADAKRESQIREAQGQAEAIMLVQKATADAIRLLNEAAPSKEVLSLKGIEAFSAAADGKATKIIIPSEMQGLAGLAVSLKELVNDK